MDLQQRAAVPADALVVTGWFSDRLNSVWWGGPTVPDPLTADWLVEQMQSAAYWSWIDADGRVQAFFGLVFPEEGLSHLIRFAIAPGMRGRGFARQLIREAIAMALARDRQRMSLWVCGSNELARRLYETTGFVPVGERRDADDPSGVSVRMLLTF